MSATTGVLMPIPGKTGKDVAGVKAGEVALLLV
jgi:hypothetical protein